MSWSYISDLDAFELYHKIREQETRSELSSFLPALRQATSGAIGSAVSNVAVYPLDLIVTRLQVQQRKKKGSTGKEDTDNDDHYNGVLDAVHKIYKHEGGLPAFYSGLTSDTIKSIADSFFFFLAYNLLWRLRKRHPAAPRRSLLAFFDEIALGCLAGAFTKALTTPLQIVVARKQTAALSSASRSADHEPHLLGRQLSARAIATDIYRAHGLAGFWSGYPASLVLTLNPSITFFVDSFLQRLLRVGDKPSAWVTFLLAAIGKVTASSIMYPVALAKARAQAFSSSTADDDDEHEQEDSPATAAQMEKGVQAPKKPKAKPGPASVLMTIPAMAREDGFTGLYAGWSGEVLKGFFSHGLTMLVKSRAQSLVLKLYFMIAEILAKQKSA